MWTTRLGFYFTLCITASKDVIPLSLPFPNLLLLDIPVPEMKLRLCRGREEWSREIDGVSLAFSLQSMDEKTDRACELLETLSRAR